MPQTRAVHKEYFFEHSEEKRRPRASILLVWSKGSLVNKRLKLHNFKNEKELLNLYLQVKKYGTSFIKLFDGVILVKGPLSWWFSHKFILTARKKLNTGISHLIISLCVSFMPFGSAPTSWLFNRWKPVFNWCHSHVMRCHARILLWSDTSSPVMSLIILSYKSI